jgi:resuscitation-promoting factor RpfA
VLAILREEAERETQARLADAKPLETQTDLGLESAMLGGKKAGKKVEVISSDDPVVGQSEDDDAKPSGRRTLLPDVEEINSTLRPSEQSQDQEMGDDGMPAVAETRSSFRSGFLLVMAVAIIGAAVYGSAGMIADLVPALAGPLEAYVSFIDSLRLQLDGLMQNATVAINGGDS